MGKFVGGEKVAPAQLHPVDAEPVGRQVEQLLAHGRALEAAGCTVGAAGGLVGEHHPGPTGVGRHPVRAGQHGQRQLGNDDAVGADVAAVVVQDIVAQPQDRPLVVQGDLDAVVLLAGVVDRDEVLGPVLRPCHWSAQPLGQPRHEEVFGVELAADTESAAGVDMVHPDVGGVETEEVGEHLLVEDGHLGGTEDVQLPAGSRLHDQRTRLHRYRGVPADVEVQGHHVCGVLEGGVDVAVT